MYRAPVRLSSLITEVKSLLNPISISFVTISQFKKSSLLDISVFLKFNKSEVFVRMNLALPGIEINIQINVICIQ